MINKEAKDVTRQRVHSRIRKKVSGTAARPRLNVYRSTSHLYVQVIDDQTGTTLLAVSTLTGSKAKKGEKHPTGGNLGSAKELGKSVAKLAKEKGITKVVFDRGGYLYHGRIKALADAAREGGLEF